MTDDQIRKAAAEAFDRTLTEGALSRIEAVYRAGMEAGRAEAAAKPKRRKAAAGDDDPGATVKLKELIGAGVHPYAAEDWLRVRKQHKAPLTRSAWDATIREASAANMTIGAVVQMCAERSWRGFRAEYVTQNARPGAATGRMDRQLETAALMTGAARPAPTDMGEIYDVGQQRIAGR